MAALHCDTAAAQTEVAAGGRAGPRSAPGAAELRYDAGVAGELDGPRLRRLLDVMGIATAEVVALAGDASTRRFFRVRRAPDALVVVAVYPPGAEAAAAHDAAVQRWGLERGLPLPGLVASCPGAVASEDLGDENLEVAARERGGSVAGALVATLAALQRCERSTVPNPPFDAAFFRRELSVFESFALADVSTATGRFLDSLAERLGRHPFRLVHRDFHVHNLFWTARGVRTVDFQDMRGGPDTYDAASLLRERGGSDLFADWLPPTAIAAACGWQPGWELRLQECAVQRGLKVIGTFLRLASQGRRGYLRWLPEVRARALEILPGLGAPPELLDAVSRTSPFEGV